MKAGRARDAAFGQARQLGASSIGLASEPSGLGCRKLLRCIHTVRDILTLTTRAADDRDDDERCLRRMPYSQIWHNIDSSGWVLCNPNASGAGSSGSGFCIAIAPLNIRR